jgi:hypothetical protein
MAFLCTLKRNMTEMWYFHISNVNLIYNCGSVVMTQVSTWVCNTQISLLTQAGNATQVSSRMCQRKLNVYHIDIFLALDTSSCTSACVRSELDLRAAFELRKNQPDMRIESNSNDSGWHSRITRVCARQSSFTPHTSGECDPGLESDLSRVVIRTYSRIILEVNPNVIQCLSSSLLSSPSGLQWGFKHFGAYRRKILSISHRFIIPGMWPQSVIGLGCLAHLKNNPTLIYTINSIPQYKHPFYIHAPDIRMYTTAYNNVSTINVHVCCFSNTLFLGQLTYITYQ